MLFGSLLSQSRTSSAIDWELLQELLSLVVSLRTLDTLTTNSHWQALFSYAHRYSSKLYGAETGRDSWPSSPTELL